ncbi:glycosyltransferase [Epibacterium ulvae]|uniref:glycosyltransferase n=1 Tax=Epibacterium ulvae TaxID=1156985 RepID=UPI00203E4A6D|nr:glycosyltransferase [Epibacterium ulvae]
MPKDDSKQGRMPAPRRVVVFGFDVAEISQIRRIRAMTALGHQVHSFTMRRDNMNQGFEPEWPNTHLFDTENENLPKRVAVVLKSIVKMAGHRAKVKEADAIFARNLDMLAIAWAARFMAGAHKTPLVYECLDINGALCRSGKKGDLMRAAERFLLRRVQMLVVSSPGFLREFFEPTQGYTGPTALWENKLAAGSTLPDRPKTRAPIAHGRPLRIGWVGTIRCTESLEILTGIAATLPDQVEIVIHGIVHRHAIDGFDEQVAAHHNITYSGGYAYPDDLARIYQDCDVVWAQDLWQRGNNSDWLLPNRIYEASWAGCPSIAVAQTETGRRIDDDGLGWTIAEPTAAALSDLIAQVMPEQVTVKGQALLDRPDTDFVQSYGEIQDVIDAVCPQKEPVS